ncbi:MAG: ATP-binding cassette domain-containing protein, partial [Bacteroidales bacterium]|nr:ATP-binding cassette domain-containing protein [Bacteroidales bacterium]
MGLFEVKETPTTTQQETTAVQPPIPHADSGKYESVDVVNLDHICLSFITPKNKVTLFDDFSLAIRDFKEQDQFISIMGQSGCGKSTILNLIAGLVKPDSGKIRIYGKEIGINDSIPMVFQHYSSYPWLNVIDNVYL